jgi:intein-encoded DNA endonuclease-like protein
MSKKAKILSLLKSGKSINTVAKLVKVKPQYVYYVRWIDKNKKPSKIVKAVKETKAELKVLLPQSDLVNHPAHYKAGGVETIDFIEAKDLNYRLGNVIKYVSRAGKKNFDPVQDLEKAAWYLNREIEARKSA